jgi:EAL domain-containing protein (putative c-di-GMP-specific phosphodiesterase class I)
VSRPEEQLERLLAEGLTEVQGYRFSHPVPAMELSKILGAADILAPAARETINAA